MRTKRWIAGLILAAALGALLIVNRPAAAANQCTLTGSLETIAGPAAANARVYFKTVNGQSYGGTVFPPGSFSVTTDAGGNLPGSPPVTVPQGAIMLVTVGGGQPVQVQIPLAGSADLSTLILANTHPPALISAISVAAGGDFLMSATSPPAGGVGTATLQAGHVTAIQGMPVVAALPLSGQFLIENAAGTQWVPASLGGDVSASGFAPGEITVNQASAASFQANVLGDIDVMLSGAKGDTVIGAGNMDNNSTATLTATSGTFTSVMVGKVVVVMGAGSSTYSGTTVHQTVVGTVTGYTDSGHVTLSFTNLSGGAISGVMWAIGTDDTAAIQSAINAGTWQQCVALPSRHIYMHSGLHFGNNHASCLRAYGNTGNGNGEGDDQGLTLVSDNTSTTNNGGNGAGIWAEGVSPVDGGDQPFKASGIDMLMMRLGGPAWQIDSATNPILRDVGASWTVGSGYLFDPSAGQWIEDGRFYNLAGTHIGKHDVEIELQGTTTNAFFNENRFEGMTLRGVSELYSGGNAVFGNCPGGGSSAAKFGDNSFDNTQFDAQAGIAQANGGSVGDVMHFEGCTLDLFYVHQNGWETTSGTTVGGLAVKCDNGCVTSYASIDNLVGSGWGTGVNFNTVAPYNYTARNVGSFNLNSQAGDYEIPPLSGLYPRPTLLADYRLFADNTVLGPTGNTEAIRTKYNADPASISDGTMIGANNYVSVQVAATTANYTFDFHDVYNTTLSGQFAAQHGTLVMGSGYTGNQTYQVEVQEDGAVVVVPLAATWSGVTGSIGGGAVAAGACTSGTATITGVGGGVCSATASGGADPATGFFTKCFASAANTVTVELCNASGVSATPTAENYLATVTQVPSSNLNANRFGVNASINSITGAISNKDLVLTANITSNNAMPVSATLASPIM